MSHTENKSAVVVVDSEEDLSPYNFEPLPFHEIRNCENPGIKSEIEPEETLIALITDFGKLIYQKMKEQELLF